MSDIIKFAAVGFVLGAIVFLYPELPGTAARAVISFVQVDPDAEPTSPAAAPISPPTQNAAYTPPPNNTGSSSRMRIRADSRGHFVAQVEINGRSTEALIDTGATVVALPESVARGSGIHVKPSDFTSQVNTANGRVNVAPVDLRRVQIGNLSVRNVKAVVIPDDSLSVVLLGMSFLGELSGFSVDDGVLLLAR